MLQQIKMHGKKIEGRLRLKDEFIKLGQALKACRTWLDSGVDAKIVIIQDGLVKVNGEDGMLREERNFMMEISFLLMEK